MNKDVKSLIEEIQKFDITEYTEDDNVIDNDTINNIIFNDLPNFPGSDEFKNLLISYNWEDRTDVKKFKWEGESIQTVDKYLNDSITNILYTETSDTRPLDKFLQLVDDVIDQWPQYQNDWKALQNNKYCCVYYYGNYELRILEYNGVYEGIHEETPIPRACIIRPYWLYDYKRYALTITIYSNIKGFWRNNGLMKHAPIELFDLFKKFAEKISLKKSVNEELNNFDITKYDNEDNELIDNNEINNITFGDLPKFPGSEQIKSCLLKYDWNNIKGTLDEYRYIRHIGEEKIITNLLSADTSSEYPLDELVDLFKKLANTVWEQYTNFYDLVNNEYCIIRRNGNVDITITQHFNMRDIVYGHSCYINDWYVNGKKGKRLTLQIYNVCLTMGDVKFSDIFAPIELYDFLKKFAEHFTPKTSINEDVNNFDITDYNDEQDTLIDNGEINNIIYHKFPKFKGSDALLEQLNKINWKKLPKPYTGIYTNDLTTQDGFTLFIKWFGYYAKRNIQASCATAVSYYNNKLKGYQLGVSLFDNFDIDYSKPQIILGPLKNKQYCMYYRQTASRPTDCNFIERRYLDNGFYVLLCKFIDMYR